MKRKGFRKVDKLYIFECPGCGYPHAFDERWTFNGDMKKPTFSPSLLLKAIKTPPDCRDQIRCHLFLTDGKLIFLNDSEHHLKGKTVDLEELENWSSE